MKSVMKLFLIVASTFSFTIFSLAASAMEHDIGKDAMSTQAAGDTPTAERAMILSLEAEITAIDAETRQVSLIGPQGITQTLTIGPEIKRLNELSVGDTVLATYVTSVVAELREPTEAEKMQPFVEVKDQIRTAEGQIPGGAVARTIRAVCSIEGMNRITRTVTILDAKDRLHIVGDIQPESFDMLSLGQMVIITYTEAVALSLEKKE